MPGFFLMGSSGVRTQYQKAESICMFIMSRDGSRLSKRVRLGGRYYVTGDFVLLNSGLSYRGCRVATNGIPPHDRQFRRKSPLLINGSMSRRDHDQQALLRAIAPIALPGRHTHQNEAIEFAMAS